MEIFKLAVFLALAWLGWRYIKRRHPSKEARNTKPAESQQWDGRIGSDVDDEEVDEDDHDPREAYLLEKATLSEDGRYTFDYEDGRGNMSSRRVDMLYIDGDYIDAFDHSAGGMRTFRKTRIRGEVTDTETGELIAAKDLSRKRLRIKKIDFESLGM
jgi:predicted DNA-binding transcriptional regulator YafY